MPGINVGMIYDSHALNDLDRVVGETTKALRLKIKQFDSIVVRGISGLLVGAPVALRLKVPLVVVRKPQEKSHDSGRSLINESRCGRRSVFLDDFRGSGKTEAHCADALSKYGGKITECYFYYRGDGWTEPTTIQLRSKRCKHEIKNKKRLRSCAECVDKMDDFC